MTRGRHVTRTPHWYAGVVAAVFACVTFVGLELIVGPDRLTSSRSLMFVREYTHVPWSWWGWLFLACAAGLLHWRTRTVGYFILAVVGTLFIGCSVVYTVLPGDSTNVIVSGLSPLAALMLWAGARYGVRAEREHRAGRK